AGTVSLHRIVPFSLEFCTKVSDMVSTSRVADGFRPALLVYWGDGAFVMSDDYFPFLAYRSLKIESVPVAILGDFPPEIVSVSATGGTELFPPVVIGAGAEKPPCNPELEQCLLDLRLRKAS